MVTPEVFLQELGFSSKEQKVYVTLLRRGPSSVRQLAESAEINRGTTYDVLKSLQTRGLVTFYDQGKKAYFVAEDPSRIINVLQDRKDDLKRMQGQANEVVERLKSISVDPERKKPVARYFAGAKAIRSILLEVLEDVSSLKEKRYFVYSSPAIAQQLYTAIPDFTQQRIEAGLFVSVIAFDNGKLSQEELSERRVMHETQHSPTYSIIFGDKTAFISLDDAQQPQGVLIEDKNLAQNQRLLFEALWITLKN